jgi:GT2 family glycosyltransferase
MNMPDRRPSCSVIIATYNRPEALAVTLDDLRRQSLPPDEVLVLDQSPAAPGPDLEHALSSWGPKLRYFRLDVANAQQARNRGIRESRGEVLVLVDDDMRLPENFLTAHLANYADRTIDGVAGQVLKPGQRPTLVLPAACRHPRHGWLRFPLHYAHRTVSANWPSCNGSVKQSVAVAIGGFDEQFTRTLYDDTDFSHRLAMVGAKIIFDPAATAVHRKVPAGGRRPSALNTTVLADAENWGTVFYCWRKNFGLWPVRVLLARKLRGVFFRKMFLRNPRGFYQAAREMVRGWKLASRKLAEGPRYGRLVTEE